MEGIEKSLDLLCNIRQLSTLVDIRIYVNAEKQKLDYRGTTEYEYCAINSRFETLQEIEDLLNNKIEVLSKQTPI
jgi:hypothetical protein